MCNSSCKLQTYFFLEFKLYDSACFKVISFFFPLWILLFEQVTIKSLQYVEMKQRRYSLEIFFQLLDVDLIHHTLPINTW